MLKFTGKRKPLSLSDTIRTLKCIGIRITDHPNCNHQKKKIKFFPTAEKAFNDVATFQDIPEESTVPLNMKRDDLDNGLAKGNKVFLGQDKDKKTGHVFGEIIESKKKNNNYQSKVT